MKRTATPTKRMACAFMNCSRGVKSHKGAYVFPIFVTTASDDDDDDIDDLYAHYVPVTVLRASLILLNLHNIPT